jgi:hypothetical protein
MSAYRQSPWVKEYTFGTHCFLREALTPCDPSGKATSSQAASFPPASRSSSVDGAISVSIFLVFQLSLYSCLI